MSGHWQRHGLVANFPREAILNFTMVGKLYKKLVFMLMEKEILIIPSHRITLVTHIKVPNGMCGMSDLFKQSKLVNVK